MNQDLTKDLANEKPKRAVLRKRLKLAYIVLIHIVVLALLIQYLDARGRITQVQAERIAMSYALQKCVSLNDTRINCASLKLGKTIAVGFEFYYIDQPYWSIGYFTTSGQEQIGGVINLSLRGKPLTVEQLT